MSENQGGSPPGGTTAAAQHAVNLERILDAAAEGVYGLDTEGRTTFVNPAGAAMLGWEPEELLGVLQHEAIHHSRPDGSEYPTPECPIYASIRRGEVSTVDHEVFWRKDGSSFPVEYTTTPVWEDGEIVGGVVTFRDITERRTAQQELERNRQLLGNAEAIANLGSWQWDVGQNRVTWSDQLHRIYGLEPGEFEGTVEAFLTRLDPDDRDRIYAEIERAMASGTAFRFEERIVRPDGSVRILDSQGEVERDADGTPVRLTGICRDVTDQRRAEERELELLREQIARSEAEAAQKEIRSILESITEGFFAMDREWRVTYMNEAAGQMIDRSPEEMIGLNLWEEFPEAVDSLFYEKYHEAVATGKLVEFQEYYPPFDQWFEVRAYPSDQGLAVYFHDITEERRREEALRMSEVRYRFLTDAIPQQVWTSRPDGKLDFVNEQVVTFFRRGAQDIIGDGWQSVVHPDDLELVVTKWTHSLKTGDDYEVEFRLRRHDGVYRWHLGRAKAQKDESGRILRWFGTNTDIDDQKEAEAARDEALAELQRSNEELDRFAYVASHDLKAPLRGIANLAAWIQEDLGEGVADETRRHLELLQGRVHRLEALIDGLLQYSRAGRFGSSVEMVDSEQVVREAMDLLDLEDKVDVRLEGEFPTLRTVRSPIHQVFLNLISNAVKYNDKDDPKVVITSSQASRPGYWEFAVSDNGPGIPPEYHERIWGIFQTLQPRDRVESTGIGLSVVKKIVEAQGGTIHVESDEGAGATFRFTWSLDRDR